MKQIQTLKATLNSERVIACDPAPWRARIEAVEAFKAEMDDDEEECMDRDIWGDPIPKMEIVGNVAVIPVKGILMAGVPSLFKCFGYVDPSDVESDIDAAMADARVEKIVLDICSPGGSVRGIDALAAKIEAIQIEGKKPIYCFGEQICSAAYWIAAGSSGIFATSTASVGSIGVYSVFVEDAQAYEQMGFFRRVFASGKYKGAGESGRLTTEQGQLIQEQVDELATMFKGFVTKCRSMVKNEDMEGQSFFGFQAANRGLIDGLCNSPKDLFEKI